MARLKSLMFFFLSFSDQSKNSNGQDLLLETHPANVDKTPNMSPGPDQTSLDLFRQDGERFQCPSCDSSYSRKDNLKAHLKKFHGENDLKDYLSNDLESKNLKSKDLESTQNQNEAGTKQFEKVDSQEDQIMDQKEMTQESFLGYFNLVRKGTEHQINSGAIVEKKTRKSGRLSNPHYDTTQFYETIYDKKTLQPAEDKKKLQCPSCENKYSRKDYLENHIRKTHEEKADLNSDSNSSFDTESHEKEEAEKEVTVVNSNKKTCIPCEKTYFSSRDLKRHEQSLVHLSKIQSMDKKDVKYQSDQDNQNDQKKDINNVAGFQCPYCDSYFTQKSSVKTHVRLKHEGMLEVTDFSRISFIDSKDQKDLKNQNDLKLRRKTAGDFPCIPCGRLYRSSYDLNRHKDTYIHKNVIKHSKMDQKDQIKLKNLDIEEIKMNSSRRRTIGDYRLNNLAETRKSSSKVNVKVFEQNVESIVDLKDFNSFDLKSINHDKTAREVEESLNDPSLGTVFFECNRKKCLLKLSNFIFIFKCWMYMGIVHIHRIT